MNVKKILIIGFDGLSWDIVDNFLEKGYLTIFREWKEKGVAGSIETIPPSTPPMWTSITSGVNPGKHSLYGFLEYDSFGRKIGISNTTNVKHPRLHDYISQNNGKSIIVNLPFSSWPRIPFKGSLISDWLSPKKYGYPIKVNEILKKNIIYYLESSDDETICKFILDDIINLSSLLEAIETDEYEYIYININFVDKAIHIIPREIYSITKSCFRKNLRTLEKLLTKLYYDTKDDAIITIVSDHGVQTVTRTVNVNRILYDNNFIEVMYAEDEAFIEEKTGIIDNFIIEVSNKMVRLPVISKPIIKLGKWILARNPSSFNVSKKIKRPRPNPEKSIAFMVPGIDGAVYINKEKIREEEYNNILNKILDLLREYEKSKILYKILTKTQLFDGPYIDEAPDLIVVPEKGYKFSLGLTGKIIEKTPLMGTHHYKNMHIILSPDPDILEVSKSINSPWDYAILSLHAMQLPLPHDHDSNLLIHSNLRKAIKKKNYNTRYEILRKMAKKGF